MDRKIVLATLAVVAIAAVVAFLWTNPYANAVLYLVKGSLGVVESAPPDTPPKMKPVCTSPVNPNMVAPTNCIPPYLANLPPDPGPAGETQFIDVDKNGLRDDVERKMAERWGDSPLAMAILTRVALGAQLAVQYGDDLPKEAVLKLGQTIRDSGQCYALVASQTLINDGGLEKTQAFVMNTPERTKRFLAFNYLFANGIYDLNTAPTAEICGFDPAAYRN